MAVDRAKQITMAELNAVMQVSVRLAIKKGHFSFAPFSAYAESFDKETIVTV